MLKSGAEHLESLRDGRVVYIGGERVSDVTRHPAFAAAARTVAALYDMKRDPANRETLSFDEGGERFSMYFLLPRTRDDLVRRMRAHKAIADATYGLFGRSPDHVASFVVGLAMQPHELQAGVADGRLYRDNLLSYYREERARDHYTAYAVVPAPGTRDPEFFGRAGYQSPTLRVTKEDDRGVLLSGMKLLATAAILANDVWIGNVQPLAPSQAKESITCAVPINAPGLSLWSRKPLATQAASEFDNPLAYRFDETDSIVLFEDVRVPWERVFVHDQAVLSREIYIRTPSHSFGNHQSNVRFWSKLQLLLALASRITEMNNIDKVPAVRETLGRLASFEAALAGMIHGQCLDHETLPEGYVAFNRRYMYGALNWCTEMYPAICELVRELMGGGVFLLPADATVMHDEKLRKQFESYWATPRHTALERMKLFRLAWDLVGSEFAGRHMQYEKFYAGPSFIVRDHSYRECPWGAMHKIVDDLMARYDVPKPGVTAAR